MNQSVAIVTGASQGIGRATSIRLARDFSAIVLVARNTTALAEVATAVKSVGAEPLICGLDLSKPEAPETLVRSFRQNRCLVKHRGGGAANRLI